MEYIRKKIYTLYIRSNRPRMETEHLSLFSMHLDFRRLELLFHQEMKSYIIKHAHTMEN